MSEVIKPRLDIRIPRMAIFRFSDFIPKYPSPNPINPMIVPQIGINPAQKLSTPKTTENMARNLFVRSSGSKLV